jgi:hypothetical protein
MLHLQLLIAGEGNGMLSMLPFPLPQHLAMLEFLLPRPR